MRVTKYTSNIDTYYTVSVDANEIRPGDPPTCIGTFHATKDNVEGNVAKIRIWMPAGGVKNKPEYRRLVKELLLKAAQTEGFTVK